LFSTGVPVSAQARVRGSSRHAKAVVEAEFLILCASSMTTTSKWVLESRLAASVRICSYDAISTGIGKRYKAARFSLGPSTRLTKRFGAQRASSRSQFSLSEAGVTTSALSQSLSCNAKRRAIAACTVLPRPMSSASNADRLRTRKLLPSHWYARRGEGSSSSTG